MRYDGPDWILDETLFFGESWNMALCRGSHVAKQIPTQVNRSGPKSFW